MDLLQLEHFLAVVDEGSFTRAAERVHRTQSAVSQSVRKIEDLLGSPVFCRDTPDLCLTAAGRVLADYARKMVRLRDQAMRSLDDLKQCVAGTVSVVAHESAAAHLLPGPVSAFLRAHPQIRLTVRRAGSSEIPRQVIERQVDVGFVREDPGFRELQVVEVHADEMTLVAPAGHPLSRRARVSLADLADEPFVRHDRCPSCAAVLERAFAQHHLSCRVVADVSGSEDVKRFVEAGVGLALVPRLAVVRELEAGTLVEIAAPEFRAPRTTRMVFRDERFLSDAARVFVSTVRRFRWETASPPAAFAPSARLAGPRPVPGRHPRTAAPSPSRDGCRAG
ncbi:MAG: LysR family transcriptional regulator [Vicinamibacteraceae bacterium]|nr:LysR family transcriptional regulator [Vicinamibacteraceae bacterium]